MRRLLNARWFQIVGLVVLLLFVADQSYAYAMECHSWYYHIGILLLEMCPVRHPLGHWGGLTTAALTLVQWGLLVGGVTAGVVLIRRRQP